LVRARVRARESERASVRVRERERERVAYEVGQGADVGGTPQESERVRVRE